VTRLLEIDHDGSRINMYSHQSRAVV